MSKLSEWFERKTEEAQQAAPTPEQAAAVSHDAVVGALRQVYDPEIPVNIYDLGLIYEVDIDDAGAVKVEMTLTAPGCPVAQEFPSWVEEELRQVEGVSDASVEIVWDPPWTPDRMSEAAKLELGML